jgi:hypothetical protein
MEGWVQRNFPEISKKGNSRAWLWTREAEKRI